jgi:hypothetical protein
MASVQGVDRELMSANTASDYRPDLRAAGIGHGRYGWGLPVFEEL